MNKIIEDLKLNEERIVKVILSDSKKDVKKIVFSSTAATYGEPDYVPIDEKHPQCMVERNDLFAQ